MKTAKTTNIKFKIALSFLFFFLLGISTYAQDSNSKKSDPDQAKKEAFERGDDILIKMVDENGNEMKYIATRQVFMETFEKIKEYDKQNGITDRSNNEYIVNSKFEFIEVRKKK